MDENISPADLIKMEIVPSAVPQKNEDISEALSLTPEQELLILKEWNSRLQNPPSLKELVQLAYGLNYDGRGVRGKIVKSFLANRDIKARPAQVYIPKPPIYLTEEQKQFIANHFLKMSAREIAIDLFNNKNLTPLSQESLVVSEFIKSLDTRVKIPAETIEEPPPVVYEERKEVSTVYAAPKIESAMINKINKYIDEPIDFDLYSQNDKQKRWVKALIAYLNSYRFLQQINTYTLDADRKLFESSFISYTYTKDDLTPEERDEYIILCSEIVISKSIQERIEKFQRIADESLDGDEEHKKISMSIVEMISGMRNEYNASIKRQQSLMDGLKVKRSKRIQERVSQNESLLGLLDFWRSYDKRQLLIKFASERKKKISEEITRLENMEDMKFQIFGVSKEEILNS